VTLSVAIQTVPSSSQRSLDTCDREKIEHRLRKDKADSVIWGLRSLQHCHTSRVDDGRQLTSLDDDMSSTVGTGTMIACLKVVSLP
jgi:hypothetical protein